MNWQTARSTRISEAASGTDDEPSEVRSEAAPSSSGDDSMLGIRGVCDRTGLSARTVRYYEELGLLPGVPRRTGGRRVYGADELERLRFIQRLKTLGLTLQEIKDLNALYALAGSTTDMLLRLDDLLDSHLTGLDQRIAQLTHLRDEMSKYREHIGSRIETDAESSASSAAGPAPTDPLSEPAEEASSRLEPEE